MLEELRNLEYTPTKDGIIYFLCKVLGENHLSIEDIKVLCSHAPGEYKISAVHLISYCKTFGWIKADKGYYLSDELILLLDNDEALNNKLIADTVYMLFNYEIFNNDMFSYDLDKDKIIFKNELFSLWYSAIRNTLINQGVIEVEREINRTNFYISEGFSSIFINMVKKKTKKLSLDQLKKKFEEEEQAGELAEQYVLEFEKRRLPEYFRTKIRKISDIDVSAGYDIASFHSEISRDIDRFIEVKAVNHEAGFFWSSNEYKVAKLKGEHYYLYLVELSRISEADYEPIIISNPAKEIMESDIWYVETDSYRIRKIFSLKE